MERGKTRIESTIIDPKKFGISFSLKQCRNFQIDQVKALKFLIEKMGWRRFRLMSYWDEHEKSPGQFDFKQLDQQINMIEKAGGKITLCLGARQPRWPESHWPAWSLELPQTERYQALYGYLAVVVSRYQNNKAIVSYQLENEALNRGFGLNGDFNRKRLRHELILVKKLDPTRPVVMSASNNWGIPLRRPWPDRVAFSYYKVIFDNVLNNYSNAPNYNFLHKLRSFLIMLLYGFKPFIHELQLEPWGPKAIWHMSTEDQNKSMNKMQIIKNITLAKKTNLYPIDIWGSEWWYWRHLKKDDEIWRTIQNILKD